MTDIVLPIKPSDIGAGKLNAFPAAVITCWNDLIAKCYTSGSAEIKHVVAVSALMQTMNVERTEVYRQHWLDIEELYESVGWHVVYDKPAYNESYPATFTFTPKK